MNSAVAAIQDVTKIEAWHDAAKRAREQAKNGTRLYLRTTWLGRVQINEIIDLPDMNGYVAIVNPVGMGQEFHIKALTPHCLVEIFAH